MSTLGTIEAESVRRPALLEFVSRHGRRRARVMGNYGRPPNALFASYICRPNGVRRQSWTRIRGAGPGRNMWEKLSNVQGKGCSPNYLKNEYPADHRGRAVEASSPRACPRAWPRAYCPRELARSTSSTACSRWKRWQKEEVDRARRGRPCRTRIHVQPVADAAARRPPRVMAEIFSNNFDRQNRDRAS